MTGIACVIGRALAEDLVRNFLHVSFSNGECPVRRLMRESTTWIPAGASGAKDRISSVPCDALSRKVLLA